ncbi:SNF2 family N-terminal domain-containing protein [Roridomyces roridus]|uniref:SNF2 family N-terminal domain-containing protein n=1 Tax=Roridomyces roridus TaxID=1738132 RepID=A0AAD7FJ00_9AGAR|nr:SNF2 family N-terminal domain-containing protein [Roridomyces roridus]
MSIRISTLEAPVYLLDAAQGHNIPPPGADLILFSDQYHRISRGMPAPALFVKSSSDVAPFGTLASYHHAPNLQPWMQEYTGIEFVSKMPENHSRSAPHPYADEKIITIEIWAPQELADLYRPRMLWVLTGPERNKYQLDVAQSPPPAWQVALQRERGLSVEILEECNWTADWDAVDVYTGTSIPILPSYEAKIQGLNAKLFPHQRQAVGWMISQENPQLPTAEPTQLWTLLGLGANARPTFGHEIIKSFRTYQPELGRGGILADDMGLGKTLTALALFMKTKDELLPGIDQTTLIVAPLSILGVWEDEIRARCPALKYIKYYPGKGNTTPSDSDPKRWKKMDVILTNYETVRNEERIALFESLHWRAQRLILDEAHKIRNAKSKTHEAISRLRAHSRWALTGTPILNGQEDIRSLISVLQMCKPITPEKEKQHWTQYIGSGSEPDPKRKAALITNTQKLLRCVCLRRTKETLNAKGEKIVALPPVIYQSVEVGMYPHQKGVYQSIARSIGAGAAGSKQLVIILRLRQAALHSDLVSEHLLSQTTCHICFETISEDEGSVSCNGAESHTYCSNCATNECQLCVRTRTHASIYVLNNDYIQESADSDEDDADMEDTTHHSSPLKSAKLDVLVDLLHRIPVGEKALVFSSFVRFLDLVELRLSEEGIESTSFDGRMSLDDKSASLTRASCDNSSAALEALK